MEVRHLLVVGLGNLGKEYDGTRHNAGFEAIDAFARAHRIPAGRRSGPALHSEARIGDTHVHLLKPTTYMNLSGNAVAAFLRHKPLPLANILVVSDDIHLPLGKVRLRARGSDGGHNGLKDISSHLHSTDYARLRIGVGEPASAQHQIDYVLGRMSVSEKKELSEVIDRCTAAIETWISDGIEAAMNKFNG